ncbi:MAG: enoyl-CoA hydratase/isomerase family protein [Alphaproteobacteria bacterium]|nr:enoyl-CoA hydratase/isomerase family protein [Alphaproteobacteria bacterium]MDE2110585.1 enoyl-CoA hydratase/isomerase family protein [Alphaproteobacteria bacterium]MDE2492687.1 enoyl-CoA hydratase/isomerase family protein [Alphaproteobacteria bacterium]
MTDEVLFERRGGVGLITLNRPKALNALTHDMVVAMKRQLRAWAEDAAVGCVVIRGAGGRAFCAGGDIRAVAESGRARSSYALDFWRDEYILNAAIKHYKKPYLALISGIAMGGGLGVSVHGTYRVVDETALFAMPETGIGFFPDVGGSFFLPRCPGETGLYLALTGARLKSTDALYTGLATHFVPAAASEALLNRLAEGETPVRVLADLAQSSGDAPLARYRETIDRIFSLNSVDRILAALDAETDAWSRETAATIRTKSPTSLRIVVREMRAGKGMTLDDCLRMEFRMASRILVGLDFYEGVRAVLVDKDQSPRWQPASLAQVSDEAVGVYFESLGDKELPL